MVSPARLVPPTLTCVVLLLACAPGAAAAPPSCPSPPLIVLAPGAQVAFPPNPCTDPENDPYTLEVITQPTRGMLAADGSSYTAAAGAHGFDSFTYRAVVSPTEQSDPATVNLLVDRVPVCHDAVASTRSNTALVLPELPCEDPDGDVLTTLIGDPQHGTIDISDDGLTVTYTPAPGFTGTDTLEFGAEEDAFPVQSEPSTLTITVTAPPPPAAPAPPAPSGATPKPPDLTAPGVTLRVKAKRLKTVLRNGLSLRLTATEDASATIALTVSRATARALGLKRKPRRPVRVGGASAALRPGDSTVAITLTAKARKAMRAARRVKLLVTVVMSDAAGNRATRTLTVTLKR